MNILILNPILFTAEHNIIPKVKSIKDTMIYNMCLGFIQLGHNITLAAAEEYHPTESETYEFNVIFFPSLYTKFCPPSVLPYSPSLKKYLRQSHKKFDLIISSEVFSFNSLFAAEICPQKTIVWQELTEHQKKFHKIPSKIWHNIIARLFITKVLAVVPRSQKALDFISQYIPTVSKTIVDHGINIEKFKYSTDKKRQIISSSQLIHRKNIDGIIQKFYNLHHLKGYEDIKLIIAGRGEEELKLKELVKVLNLQDYVNFVGFLSQIKLNDYISHSYAFLINTRKDLNMVSIPESIVSGTPILTNNQPASADYIAKNDLGIVKDNWDENDIVKIIDDNTYYTKNCIQYREKLTNQHSAQLFIEIFNSYQNNKVK